MHKYTRGFLTLVSIAGLLAAQSSDKQPSNKQTSSPNKQTSPQSAPSAASQTSDDDTRPTFQSSVKEVMAPVTVTDKDGLNVNGLTALDFRLLDNGKPQAITVDTVAHPI